MNQTLNDGDGLNRVLDEALKRERYNDLERAEVVLLVHDNQKVEVGKGKVDQGKPNLIPDRIQELGIHQRQFR